MKKITVIALLLAAALGAQARNGSGKPAYKDAGRPVEERVSDLLSRMTLEEKVAILHAQSKFSSAGVPRLGIPEVWCTDGPHGIRPEVLWDEWDQAGWTNDSCTAFPALTCLAATWNPEMSALYGKSIGEEARYREKDILLGPGVNIYRTPLNGRNFEYMGEDPYLSSRMVVPYIEEVQKNGVAACVKHFALNNQETHRHGIDVEVDDRALNEIYLPAFKAAVQEGGAWAVMGAYNKYKGEHCCHNRYLLNDILKRDWAFDGVVVSDWGGTHDTKQAAENGLDMEFGSWTDGLSWGASNAYDNYYLAAPYLDMLRKGEASTATLDDKARRVLRLIFRTAMNTRKPFGSLNSPEHLAAARRIAGEGMVLLKNENNTLPLKAARRIAVIGPMAQNRLPLLGAWSAHGREEDAVSLFAGLENEYRGRAELFYARGCDFDGEDRSGFREAVAAAAAADVVVLCLGEKKQWSGENASRSTIALPEIQEQLAAELAQTGKPLVLVLSSGRPLELCRLEPLCGAMVQMWQPGIRGGNPLAGILSGRINPSGRLAMTFPRSTGQIPIYYNRRQSGRTHQGKYQDIPSTPLYEFGHGLSYTTFEYGDLRPSATTLRRGEKVTVEVSVTNTGGMDGAETVHWFISDPVCRISRPVRELKHFEKQPIRRGETRTFRFEIDPEKDLSFTDDDGNRFLEPGDYFILVKDKKVKLTLTD
mgnify:CR=1 FL=1